MIKWVQPLKRKKTMYIGKILSSQVPTWVWCLWAQLQFLTWRAPPVWGPRQTWGLGKVEIWLWSRQRPRPPPYQVDGLSVIRHRDTPPHHQGIMFFSWAGRCVWKTSACVCCRELGWVTVPFGLLIVQEGPSARCSDGFDNLQGPCQGQASPTLEQWGGSVLAG